MDDFDSRPDLYPGLISATPAAFARQMEFLAENFQVISMAELLHAYRSGLPVPPRSVMITFDDAYRDFAEHAWPVLQRLRLPVTLFVPTGFPNRPRQTFWWDTLYSAIRCAKEGIVDTSRLAVLPPSENIDRLRTFRRFADYIKSLDHHKAMLLVKQFCDELGCEFIENNVLEWKELRDLAEQGVTLAPHTQTHPLLNRMSLADARAEITGSFDDLSAQIDDVEPVFAYPSGGVSDQVVEVIKQAGFSLAFTTKRGINDLNQVNPLRLRRINVGIRTTETVLRSQLLAWCVISNCLGRRRTTRAAW